MTPSPQQPDNLILLGYRGCGKTTAGREVARLLQWFFVDTDEQVELHEGRSIREIFEQDGEPGFRQIEKAMVRQAVEGEKQVISVGGGAVLSEGNRVALRNAGVCVWLTAPPDVLLQRVQSDPRTAETRPALTDHDALEEIRELLVQREPLYAALAHHVVQTAGHSLDEVVRTILSIVAGDDALLEP